MEGIDVGQNMYHFKGFEITRKIVLEGDTSEMPDMLHELGDILAELGLQQHDKIIGNIMVSNIGEGRVKISAQVQSAPRKN